MKIEIGLDDRTLLSLDKLTYALQQLVRPECHYHSTLDTPSPVSPAPPAPAPPAPTPPTPPAPTPPAPPVAADPFAVGDPNVPRDVSDEELRAAAKAFMADPAIPPKDPKDKDAPDVGKDTFTKLLKSQYNVVSLRELPKEKRAALVYDLSNGFSAVVAMLGVANG